MPFCVDVSVLLNVTLFLGTLWSSIKQIKAPYLFDWEHGIALHAVQGIWASCHGESEISWYSRVAARKWGIFSSYGGDDPSKLMLVQRSQGSSLVMRDTSGISLRLDWAIRTLLEVRQESQFPFLVARVVLQFL